MLIWSNTLVPLKKIANLVAYCSKPMLCLLYRLTEIIRCSFKYFKKCNYDKTVLLPTLATHQQPRHIVILLRIDVLIYFWQRIEPVLTLPLNVFPCCVLNYFSVSWFVFPSHSVKVFTFKLYQNYIMKTLYWISLMLILVVYKGL